MKRSDYYLLLCWVIAAPHMPDRAAIGAAVFILLAIWNAFREPP
jgi:hypothetical protein